MATLNNKRQQGFGLIELMVSLVISLIVVAGLYSSLVSEQRSYANSRASISLVSKNRMSLSSLMLYLNQAGFRDGEQVLENTQFSSGTDALGYNWGVGQFIAGLNDVAASGSNAFAAAKPNSDVLALRFFGAEANSGNLYRCDGSNAAAASEITLYLFINNSNQLICRIDGDETVLDEGIEAMQVQYAQLDNFDQGYRNADQLSSNDWLEVDRVKFALLNSQELSQSLVTDTQKHQVLEQEIPAQSDRKIRQVVTKTVVLTNQGAQT